MSKYTIELRKLFEPNIYYNPLYTREEVESWFMDYELEDYLTQEQIQTINNHGTFSKQKLASKIIEHYYMREIGQETPSLFKHYAKVEMQEIMEEYLPLIYSASIEYDPLVNVDYTESFNRQATGENTGTSTGGTTSSSNSNGLNVSSDTPQGQISKSAILEGKYASTTSANENEINDETTSSTSTSANSQNQEEYIKRIKGNSGVSATAQKMVLQYRENIRALEKEIIEKLDILFMNLY